MCVSINNNNNKVCILKLKLAALYYWREISSFICIFQSELKKLDSCFSSSALKLEQLEQTSNISVAEAKVSIFINHFYLIEISVKLFAFSCSCL